MGWSISSSQKDVYKWQAINRRRRNMAVVPGKNYGNRGAQKMLDRKTESADREQTETQSPLSHSVTAAATATPHVHLQVVVRDPRE